MLRIWCLRPTKPAPPAHHHTADLTRSTSIPARRNASCFRRVGLLFLPVICFWRNLFKFLMPHKQLPGSCLIASLFFLENLPFPRTSIVKSCG